jgi:hypothetical protein
LASNSAAFIPKISADSYWVDQLFSIPTKLRHYFKIVIWFGFSKFEEINFFMRIAIFLLLTAGFLFSCSKDKFNAVPQITFKSISPNSWRSDNLTSDQGPVITFRLTDAEGDIDIR